MTHMKTSTRCGLLLLLLPLCWLLIRRAPHCRRGAVSDVGFFILSTSERRSQRLALELAHQGVPQTHLVYSSRKSAWSYAAANSRNNYVVLLRDEAALQYDFLDQLLCIAPLDLDIVWFDFEAPRPDQDALGFMIKRALLENISTTAYVFSERDPGSGAFRILCETANQCMSYALITRAADIGRAGSVRGTGDIFSHVGLPR